MPAGFLDDHLRRADVPLGLGAAGDEALGEPLGDAAHLVGGAPQRLHLPPPEAVQLAALHLPPRADHPRRGFGAAGRDPDRGAAAEGAAAAVGVEELARRGVQDHAEHGAAVLRQPRAHRELRAPRDERVRAVDRVHHPDAAALQPRGRVGALLREPAVRRARLHEHPVQDAVGGQVRLRHRLALGLEGDLLLDPEGAHHRLARGPHGADRQLQVLFEARRLAHLVPSKDPKKHHAGDAGGSSASSASSA